MVQGLEHAFGQIGNIFSGKPKDLTKTGTSGSAEGQAAGQWGLDQYKDLYGKGPVGYTGPTLGAQGPNAAQIQQYNMLQGMYGTVPGAVTGAVGQMTPQQITEMNRRGGPHAGYKNPFEQQVIGGLKQDYQDALEMGKNTVGMSAHGSDAFDSSRHGVAEGVMGAKAKEDFLAQTGQLRHRGFGDQMAYQRQDARDRASDIIAMNQANLGFGGLRSNVTQADIANQFNLANQYGLYGQGQERQRNLADQFRYGEFNRMQNWAPNMLGNYMAGVRGTPWQQTNVQTGQGKSDLDNLIGLGIGLGGAYLGA